MGTSLSSADWRTMGGSFSSPANRHRIEQYLPFTDSERKTLSTCATQVPLSAALGLMTGSYMVFAARRVARMSVFAYVAGGGLGLFLGYRYGMYACEQALTADVSSPLIAEVKMIMQEADPSKSHPWGTITGDDLEYLKATHVREVPRVVRRARRAIAEGRAELVSAPEGRTET